MIGWSTIAPVIKDVFSELASRRSTADEPFAAEWIDGRKPWKDGARFGITSPNGFSLGLTVTTVGAIGDDDSSEELNDANELVETQSGQRKFTLQVQSLTVANGVNADFALAITERARTRLTSRRIIDKLLDIDVGIISCGPSIFLSHRDGARMITSATMDVMFGCTAAEDDPIPVSWIQYLVISSHLKDLDGTELPPPAQMVNVEVPPIP